MTIQNKQILEEINQAEYLQEICKQTPKIKIGTQCGIGIYQFKNIGYRNGELILEFSLIMDKIRLSTCTAPYIQHFIVFDSYIYANSSCFLSHG